MRSPESTRTSRRAERAAPSAWPLRAGGCTYAVVPDAATLAAATRPPLVGPDHHPLYQPTPGPQGRVPHGGNATFIETARKGATTLTTPPTRGFFGRRHADRDPRLPPGQYDTGLEFPVLTAEVTPRLDPQTWTMTVDGLVESPRTWTWEEMHQLPPSEYRGDIHCVTTWSRLGTWFGGVSVDVLLSEARPLPAATHVLATSTTGYTTNVPLDHVTGGQAWIVWSYEGEPLPREHGGPVRLLVPHLYFWKSAKWVTRLTVLDHDEPGFWEQNGYHDLGDPWREQRYQGD